MGSCVVCRERWTGLSRAHCTGCHKTFNSVSAFDKHRPNMICIDPVKIKMEMSNKGIWSKPMPKDAVSYFIGKQGRHEPG